MDSADISITLFIYTCSNLLDIRIMNSINKYSTPGRLAKGFHYTKLTLFFYSYPEIFMSETKRTIIPFSPLHTEDQVVSKA